VWWGICIRLCYKFPNESFCERILKIGQYLVKLWARVWCLVFLTHGVVGLCAWPIVGINNVIHEFRKHTYRIATPLEKHRVTATINLFENFRVGWISGFEIYWRTDLHWWWSQIRDKVQNSHPIFVFTYINTLLVFLQYCGSYLCKAHKILPTAAFSFLPQDWLHDSPDCLLLLLSMSVFIFLFFFCFTHLSCGFCAVDQADSCRLSSAR